MRAVISAARRRAGAVVQPPPVPESPPEEVNIATFVTKVGDGAATADPVAKTLTISYGTTLTSLRGEHPVTAAQRYRIDWTQSSTNATEGQAWFGTTVGGAQYRPTMVGVAGPNSFSFTAVSTPLHLTFQRQSAGTTTFSEITVTPVPEVTWANISPQPINPTTWTVLSPGVTVNSSTGLITIPATGTLLVATGSIPTIPGTLYRLVFTVGGNNIAVPIGQTQGSGALKISSVVHGPGSHSYEFTATTTTTWIQFQRQSTGTATVSGIALQEVISRQNAFSTAFSDLEFD